MPGNVARVLPEGLAARFELSGWTPAPIFDLVAKRGRVDPDEMMATFNMGLGMVLVCERPPAGYPVVGEVVRQNGAQRVLFTKR